MPLDGVSPTPVLIAWTSAIPPRWSARFAQLRPACVIHTAYREHGPAAYATTVEGSVNVARAANAYGARLIHISTDVVFDGRGGAPYRESDPVSPITTYGRHKAEAERAVGAAHPHAVIVRTSLIYGGPQPSRHEQTALDVAAGRASLALLHRRAALPGGGVRPGCGAARAGRFDLRRDRAHRRCRRGVSVGVREPGDGQRSAPGGSQRRSRRSPAARLPARHLALPRASAHAASRRARGAQGASRSMTHAPCSRRYRKRSCRRASPCCQNSYRSGVSR